MTLHPSERERAWTRRVFLKASAVAAGAVAVGAGLFLRRPRSRGTTPATAPSPGAGALGADELADVVALGEVLHPAGSDRARRELEETIRWWAIGRTGRGPRLPLYRAGLRALAAATRRAGHDEPYRLLTHAERERVVAAIHPFRPADPFAELAAELLEGIYASAPGWRSVGYRTWPGVASPPLEYTRAPALPVDATAARSPLRSLGVRPATRRRRGLG